MMSDWWEVAVNLRVAWKCVVVECGAQSVMMDGEMLMPGLYADNLDLLQLVTNSREITYLHR